MPAHVAMISGGSHYLEVAGDLVRDGAEELLAVGLGVGAADGAALRGVAVAEDGDDERFVRAPPCKPTRGETNAPSDRTIARHAANVRRGLARRDRARTREIENV